MITGKAVQPAQTTTLMPAQTDISTLLTAIMPLFSLMMVMMILMPMFSSLGEMMKGMSK